MKTETKLSILRALRDNQDFAHFAAIVMAIELAEMIFNPHISNDDTTTAKDLKAYGLKHYGILAGGAMAVGSD